MLSYYHQAVSEDFIVKSVVKWVSIGSSKIKLHSTVLTNTTESMISKFGIVENIFASGLLNIKNIFFKRLHHKHVLQHKDIFHFSLVFY